jgi:hypothetical protein
MHCTLDEVHDERRITAWERQTIILLVRGKPTGESFSRVHLRISRALRIVRVPRSLARPVWASWRMRENAHTRRRTMAGLGPATLRD